MASILIVNKTLASEGTGVSYATSSSGAVVPDTYGEQAYFWTSTWQKWEDEADEDIRSGRTKEFTDLESLFRHLDKNDQ